MKESIEKIKELRRRLLAVAREYDSDAKTVWQGAEEIYGTDEVDWIIETVQNLETGKPAAHFLKFEIRIPIEFTGEKEEIQDGRAN